MEKIWFIIRRTEFLMFLMKIMQVCACMWQIQKGYFFRKMGLI